MKSIRAALSFGLLALCILLVACAHVDEPEPSGDEDGIGGTGLIANTDGIGGTGVQRDPDTDGIGGTGLWANAGGSGDVALYGVATSIDTLVVNGHGMFLSETTEIVLNGEPAHLEQLEPGQVVSVRAGLVDGLITAKSVHADDAVIGPIESIGADGRSLKVLGQQISINEHAGKDLTSLQTGDVVRVSGLRRLDGSIDASLVTLASPGASYLVSGWAIPAGTDRHAIGHLDFSSRAFHLADGVNQRLVISGRVSAGNFTIDKVSSRPALPFKDAVDYWSLQGYAMPGSPTTAMQFGAYRGPLSNEKELNLGTAAEQRVIVDIRKSGSSAPQVSRIVPSPSRPPDTDVFVPYYTPPINQPRLRVAPTLELPTPDSDPAISLPRATPPRVQPQVGHPRAPVTAPARPVSPSPPVDIAPPSVRPPPLPKVDIQPAVPQPASDGLPSSSVILGR